MGERIDKLIAQFPEIELSDLKQLVEDWNREVSKIENQVGVKYKELRSYGWKIRSLERLYSLEHPSYIPCLNKNLLHI
jgi:hypothetical protein